MKMMKHKLKTGVVLSSNNSGDFEVLKYESYASVLIRFISTGYTVRVNALQIKTGEIKDRFIPVVNGVGFIGGVKYKAKSKGKSTKAYDTWRHMLDRCYNDKVKERLPTYLGCTTCSEWHNFQNFAKWFYENYPDDGNSYHIDKDLKVIGNKIYSPETCMFVSPTVNAFTTDSGASRGDYLIGCSYNKKGGYFQGNCNNPFSNKMDYLGGFNNELEAHMAWRNKKYEHAISLANQQDREEVKIALLNWAQALKEFRIHPIDN